jgi:hypothetical protein
MAKRATPPAGYDVPMIQDFIEHLKWSRRVDHFECTAGPNAHNPELDEQVTGCAKKRGTPRLLTEFYLKPDKPDFTDDRMKEAVRLFGSAMAKERAEQLNHLEALETVLREALAHAAQRGVIKITVPASKVLDGSYFSPPPDDPGDR